jgi:pyruvate kinase
LTETGFTSRLISKHRPDCPIIAITSKEEYARRLSMNWGVEPLLYDIGIKDDERISFAIQSVVEAGYAESGDTLIITAGHSQRRGGTDMIRVITI